MLLSNVSFQCCLVNLLQRPIRPEIKFYLFAIACLPTLLPSTQLFFFFFAFPELFFFFLLSEILK